MRLFSAPSLRHLTVSAVGSTSDQKLILEDLYLNKTLGIVLDAKTVSKASAVAKLTLGIVAAAKTISIVVGVPNLVLSLVASAKSVSKTSAVITNILSFTANAKTVISAAGDFTESSAPISIEISAKTISKVDLKLNTLNVQGSAKTVIRTNVVLTRYSVAQRISNSHVSMVTNQLTARMLPIFRQ